MPIRPVMVRKPPLTKVKTELSPSPFSLKRYSSMRNSVPGRKATSPSSLKRIWAVLDSPIRSRSPLSITVPRAIGISWLPRTTVPVPSSINTRAAGSPAIRLPQVVSRQQANNIFFSKWRMAKPSLQLIAQFGGDHPAQIVVNAYVGILLSGL